MIRRRTGAQLMKAWRGISRRLALTLALWLVVLATSAHLGSPTVFQTAKAGPYDVRVVVRPPAVIPGRARVTVRVADASATRVDRLVDQIATKPAVGGVRGGMEQTYGAAVENDALPDAFASVLERLPEK